MLGSVKVPDKHKLEMYGEVIMQVPILWNKMKNYIIIDCNNNAIIQRLIQTLRLIKY